MSATASDRVYTGGRPLRDAYGDFLWRRPSFLRRDLVLEAGSEQLASLHWGGLFSFEATGESADGRWIMRRHRSGSLLGGCKVIDAATDSEVAEFQRHWRGTGTVRFASGAEYVWGREGFWRPNYFWAGADGKPLVTFHSNLGFSRRYEMSVEPAARSIGELPVLVLLGAYEMALAAARRHAS